MTNDKYRWKLDLQMFAGGDGLIDFPDDNDDTTLPVDDDNDDQDDKTDGDFLGLDDDEPEVNKDESPKDEINLDDEEWAALNSDDYEEKKDEDAPVTEADKLAAEEAAKTEAARVAEEAKQVQTQEENARFAEERRQRQAQELLEKSPEYQLAKKLQAQYGESPEQLLQRVSEAELAKQAKESGVPLQFLQEQRKQSDEIAALRAELEAANRANLEREYTGWIARVDVEAAKAATDYPMLTADEVTAARGYLLNTLRDVSLPLESAIYAMHGKKITDGLREIAKQEALAELSGRKGGPLVPKGNRKSDGTAELTGQQREAARVMGMSEADYLKYK